MKLINVREIHIPELFKNSKPKEYKIQYKIDLISDGKELPVILSYSNALIDGYTTYIAYIRLGYKSIPFTHEINSINTRIPDNYKLFHSENNTCYICNRKMPIEELTVDHMIPKALGGKSSMDNLRCCCKLCNNLKGQLAFSEKLKEVIIDNLRLRGINID